MPARVEWEESDGVAVVRVIGALDIDASPAVFDQLRQVGRLKQVGRVEVDLSGLETIDSSGVVVVSLAQREMTAAGLDVELTGLQRAHAGAFEMMPPPERPQPAVRRPLLERFGDAAVRAVSSFAVFAEVSVDTARAVGSWMIRRMRVSRGAMVEQSAQIGVDAVVIVVLLSYLIGLILALQAAYQLRRFGAELYMADIVGIGMVREFGPMMTGIILAGRSATGIAAELGTMAVREEIDALRSMGIWPVRFLVLPRILALTLVQPALTVLSIAAGIGGGLSLAWFYGLSVPAYFAEMKLTLQPLDWWSGMLKSVMFAWIIGLVGCYFGLTTRGGASSVGRAAQRAVVASVFLIIVVDSIVTAISTAAGNA